MSHTTNDLQVSKRNTRNDVLATMPRHADMRITNDNEVSLSSPPNFSKCAFPLPKHETSKARKAKTSHSSQREMRALQEPHPQVSQTTSLDAVLVHQTASPPPSPPSEATISVASTTSRTHTSRIMSGRAWPTSPIISSSRQTTPPLPPSPPSSFYTSTPPKRTNCDSGTHLPRLIYRAYDSPCAAEVGDLEATAKLPRISWRHAPGADTTPEVLVACDCCGRDLGRMAVVRRWRQRGVGQRQVIPYVPWTAREHGLCEGWKIWRK